MAHPDPERGKERALLAKLVSPSDPRREVEESLEELGRLVGSAGGVVVGRVTQQRRRPDPAYYIGKGKALEIKALVESAGCDLVVFDDDLSPGQNKNLEACLGKRVLDRSGLILDIFALRARTKQARLQVELAQLEYLLPRLTRMWEHLSRIRGGIGLRGPGETQLEVDRRVIRRRIGSLRRQLLIVKRRRHRQRRHRSGAFHIALVGYTNAGKSTLFNRLTDAGASVGDRLFETLDARTRRLDLATSRAAMITDTVGFIRRLPHHLIESFRATLEEVIEADLLLHVIDMSSAAALDHIRVVEGVLAEIGAGEKPVIRVFNKVDRAEDAGLETGLQMHYPGGIPTSASRGTGLDLLRTAIRDEMSRGELLMEYSLPVVDSRALSRLHSLGRVLDESLEDGRMRVRVRIEGGMRDRLSKEGIRGIPIDG